MDCIHAAESGAGDFGIWDADAKRFFHADHELKGVNGIKPEAAGPEEWEIVADLGGRCLQHQIRYQHLFDAGAEVRIGHDGREGVLTNPEVNWGRTSRKTATAKRYASLKAVRDLEHSLTRLDGIAYGSNGNARCVLDAR